MVTKTEAEAKKTPYHPFVAPREYSFELNMDMLGLVRKEFDPSLAIEKFVKALTEKTGEKLDVVAEKIFGEYGINWMRKSIQLGEEYPDRTYEILKEAADRTGELIFPLVLQRDIEIAYLGTQRFRKLTILESWARRFVYKISDCYTFKILREKCFPEVVDFLPCRHACLKACNTALKSLNINGTVKMDATMIRDSHCQFAIARI